MQTKKTVFLPFLRKFIPSVCESWLEQMEQDGWHLDSINQMSYFGATFKKGNPKKYRYCYDLQAKPKSDYVQTFKDFGWELVGKVASVYIWRKPYTTTRPEAFSDKENLDLRNKRVQVAISFSIALLLVGLIACLIPVLSPDKLISNSEKVQLIASSGFILLILAGLIYVEVQIFKNRRE